MVAIHFGIGLPPLLRSLAPLLGGHQEEHDPDRDLEPVDARVVGGGIVAGSQDEHHDDAHGDEAGDPPERERRPGGSSSRRTQDEDDGDDGNGTEGHGERRREQVADGVVHKSQLPRPTGCRRAGALNTGQNMRTCVR
jgi:hypothetical protein